MRVLTTQIGLVIIAVIAPGRAGGGGGEGGDTAVSERMSEVRVDFCSAGRASRTRLDVLASAAASRCWPDDKRTLWSPPCMLPLMDVYLRLSRPAGRRNE